MRLYVKADTGKYGIDRELARMEMVIEGSTQGAFTAGVDNIAAEKLTRKDPVPEALKKGWGIAIDR